MTPHVRAAVVADELVGDWRPSCERIEIVGDVREGRRLVSGISIVAEPRYHRDIFGEATAEDYLIVAVRRDLGDGRLAWCDTQGERLGGSPAKHADALHWGREWLHMIHVRTRCRVLLRIARSSATFDQAVRPYQTRTR